MERVGLVITGAASTPLLAAGASSGIDPDAVLGRFRPAALRRASHLCRLALPVVEAALAEAGLEGSPDMGLVVGTGLGSLEDAAGFLDDVRQSGQGVGSPQRFQRSLCSSLGAELAILYGLRGWSLTVSQGLSSGEAAFALAGLAVASGRCETCLCVAADTVSEILHRALSESGRPLDPGEGASAIVIESEVHARGRNAAVLARLESIESPRADAAVPLTPGVHCGAGLARIVASLRPPRSRRPTG